MNELLREKWLSAARKLDAPKREEQGKKPEEKNEEEKRQDAVVSVVRKGMAKRWMAVALAGAALVLGGCGESQSPVDNGTDADVAEETTDVPEEDGGPVEADSETVEEDAGIEDSVTEDSVIPETDDGDGVDAATCEVVERNPVGLTDKFGDSAQTLVDLLNSCSDGTETLVGNRVKIEPPVDGSAAGLEAARLRGIVTPMHDMAGRLHASGIDETCMDVGEVIDSKNLQAANPTVVTNTETGSARLREVRAGVGVVQEIDSIGDSQGYLDVNEGERVRLADLGEANLVGVNAAEPAAGTALVTTVRAGTDRTICEGETDSTTGTRFVRQRDGSGRITSQDFMLP